MILIFKESIGSGYQSELSPTINDDRSTKFDTIINSKNTGNEELTTTASVGELYNIMSEIEDPITISMIRKTTLHRHKTKHRKTKTHHGSLDNSTNSLSELEASVTISTPYQTDTKLLTTTTPTTIDQLTTLDSIEELSSFASGIDDLITESIIPKIKSHRHRAKHRKPKTHSDSNDDLTNSPSVLKTYETILTLTSTPYQTDTELFTTTMSTANDQLTTLDSIKQLPSIDDGSSSCSSDLEATEMISTISPFQTDTELLTTTTPTTTDQLTTLETTKTLPSFVGEIEDPITNIANHKKTKTHSDSTDDNSSSILKAFETIPTLTPYQTSTEIKTIQTQTAAEQSITSNSNNDFTSSLSKMEISTINHSPKLSETNTSIFTTNTFLTTEESTTFNAIDDLSSNLDDSDTSQTVPSSTPYGSNTELFSKMTSAANEQSTIPDSIDDTVDLLSDVEVFTTVLSPTLLEESTEMFTTTSCSLTEHSIVPDSIDDLTSITSDKEIPVTILLPTAHDINTDILGTTSPAANELPPTFDSIDDLTGILSNIRDSTIKSLKPEPYRPSKQKIETASYSDEKYSTTADPFNVSVEIMRNLEASTSMTTQTPYQSSTAEFTITTHAAQKQSSSNDLIDKDFMITSSKSKVNLTKTISSFDYVFELVDQIEQLIEASKSKKIRSSTTSSIPI